MNGFRFLDPFFNALSDGRIICSIVATGLRFLAVLTALGGLAWPVLILVGTFQATAGAPVLGGVLLALLAALSGFLQTCILLYRARTISNLGPSQFTVTAIASIFFRLIGEGLFVFFVLLGLGGAIYAGFADRNPLSQLGLFGLGLPLIGTRGVFGAVEIALSFAAIAFTAIVACYALAELTVVLVDIARNMDALRLAVAGGAPLAAAPTGPDPVHRSAVVPGKCRACESAVEAGTAFCGFCGKAV